jgi:hypothetical protein
MNGRVRSSFEEIAKVGKYYFTNLFREPSDFPIGEILRVINLFPRAINKYMNMSLQEEIIEKEILATLSSFKKGKILGPDGMIVEFYLGFYEFLKDEILKVIRESQSS